MHLQVLNRWQLLIRLRLHLLSRLQLQIFLHLRIGLRVCLRLVQGIGRLRAHPPLSARRSGFIMESLGFRVLVQRVQRVGPNSRSQLGDAGLGVRV